MWSWSISFLIFCFCLAGCSNDNGKQSQSSVFGSGRYTLSIIKPNAVEDQNIGVIIQRFEEAGLRIAGMKMLQLSREQAEDFYDVHRDKPFFNGLVGFMTSGPVVVLVLEGDDVIARNREIMGATDPVKAAAGSIRADFGASIEANAVHGSDALETAQREITFFFSDQEVVNK